MQPENQIGNGQPVQPTQQVPPVQPTAPPPVPQPVSQPAPAPTAFDPSPLPTVPAPQPTPAPVSIPQQPAPIQPPQQSLDTPVALGSVAVAEQIDDGYQYASQEDGGDYNEGEIDLSEPFKWQAKEYIHQEKGALWFTAFAIIFIIFMAVSVLLMKSWSFTLLLVVIAAVIIVYSRRPPRTMEYALSEDGLHIDSTLHKYADFKSFAVIRDGEEYSVMLIPRRRLQPGITVYFPEDAGEDIVDILGSRMPMRDRQLDAIDRLVRALRL